MDKSVSSFQFKSYQVDAVEFKINENFEPKNRIRLDFDLDSDIAIVDIDNKITKVSLHSIVFKNYKRTNKPFTMKISISGIFQFKGEVAQEQLIQFSEINATAVLFPYLRAAITHITTACNQPPVTLPLINVYQFVKEKKEKEKKS